MCVSRARVGKHSRLPQPRSRLKRWYDLWTSCAAAVLSAHAASRRRARLTMNAPAVPIRFHPPSASQSALERRLRTEVDGEVLFDAFSRGRYSTDASIYQVEPTGIVVPRSEEAACIALQ